MHKERLIIGYAPTRRNVFSREDALKYKRLTLDKLKTWGYKTVDIEGINEDGLLIGNDDIASAVKKFKAENVACVFSPHCNFGTEDVVANVAKEMNLPFLLWGPRDEAPLADGSRLRDSQCGLFATSKILQRLSVPFTYIINSRVDDDIFKRGFDNFAAAANVVKAFKKIRIGQIGTRPAPFWSVMINEAELLGKFGIEIIPYNLIDVINIAKEIKNKKTQAYLNDIEYVKKNFTIEIDDEPLSNIIALKQAINLIKDNDNISAFAIQCWTAINELLGIVPCLANSLLYDEDIAVACETDINGAVSALICQAATFKESKIIFADITIRHPEDDNKELLWHCGPFPLSLKKKGSMAKVCGHNILGGAPAGTCSFEIEADDITVVRFDGLKGNYSLFSGQAKQTEGPKTSGTYIWIKVNNWPEWEQRFIYGPYIHHIAAVNKKISSILYEVVRYIDGLYLDAIEPGIEEIKKWL